MNGLDGSVVARLVALRKEAGLRQADMGERMGIGQSRVSVFESGRHAPLPGSVEAYARALGLEVADVILPEGRADVVESLERDELEEWRREQCKAAHPSSGGTGAGTGTGTGEGGQE